MFTMGSGSSGTVWPGNAPSEIQGGGGASQSLARALSSKTGDILHPSAPQAFSGVDRGRLAPNLANTRSTHTASPTSSSPSQASSPKWTETTPRLEISLSRAAGVQYFLPWIPVEPEQPFQFGTPMSIFLEQMHARMHKILVQSKQASKQASKQDSIAYMYMCYMLHVHEREQDAGCGIVQVPHNKYAFPAQPAHKK